MKKDPADRRAGEVIDLMHTYVCRLNDANRYLLLNLAKSMVEWENNR